MPQPKSISPGKGRDALRQKKKSQNLSAKIWYGLTVHIRFLILNLQRKILKFFKFTPCILAKFPANQAKFAPFAHILHE